MFTSFNVVTQSYNFYSCFCKWFFFQEDECGEHENEWDWEIGSSERRSSRAPTNWQGRRKSHFCWNEGRRHWVKASSKAKKKCAQTLRWHPPPLVMWGTQHQNNFGWNGITSEFVKIAPTAILLSMHFIIKIIMLLLLLLSHWINDGGDYDGGRAGRTNSKLSVLPQRHYVVFSVFFLVWLWVEWVKSIVSFVRLIYICCQNEKWTRVMNSERERQKEKNESRGAKKTVGTMFILKICTAFCILFTYFFYCNVRTKRKATAHWIQKKILRSMKNEYWIYVYAARSHPELC